MGLLPSVTIGPQDAEYCVIWLHGLGADGHDFEPIVAELDFPNKGRTRFIFPHAPSRAVTINNGYVMPAWYDIVAISETASDDEQGIHASQQQIISLIENEKAQGLASEKIILAGFSQGGAIALQTALRYAEPLAGLLALSTYLPLRESLATEASSQNKDIEFMMLHGEYDPVIPIELAQASKQYLFEQGYSVEWKTYPMEHSVCPQEIADIGGWFGKVLA